VPAETRTHGTVARAAGERKGGQLTGAALVAEVAHPGANRVITHAEALADGLGGKPLDKKGVQGGEAPVQGLDRFEEEAAAGGIVHDGLRGEGELLAVGKTVG
jgi:hypothetical protein